MVAVLEALVKIKDSALGGLVKPTINNMSWSKTLIGNPQNIVDALKAESEKLEGQSKVEFDAALPHMVGLLEQNFSVTQIPVVKLTASGHGYTENGEHKQRQCLVQIENLYGTLV
jgi:hypothetical protein